MLLHLEPKPDEDGTAVARRRVAEHPPPARRECLLGKLLTLQDGLLLGYLVVALAVVLGRASPETAAVAQGCAQRLYVALVVVLLGAFLARSGVGGAWWRGAIYRACLVGVIVANYLMLRDLLPLVRPDTIDETLHGVDLWLFGVEPALWLQRFNERPVIEWFSFFYFSYFWIAGAYVLVVAVLRPGGRSTSEFAIGVLLVFCLGQLGYMLVPGFGPVGYLASHFDRPIDGGFFWGCVSRTVSAGSAMKDIFPSLHTAVPTFFTYYAWRRARHEPGWRLATAATGFFAANIIVSTMLLRWHFAIDVVAGLTLGIVAGRLAPRLAAAEHRHRRRVGLAPPWDFSRSIGAPRSAAPLVSAPSTLPSSGVGRRTALPRSGGGQA